MRRFLIACFILMASALAVISLVGRGTINVVETAVNRYRSSAGVTSAATSIVISQAPFVSENMYAPNGSSTQSGTDGCCLFFADNMFHVNGPWGTLGRTTLEQNLTTFASADMSGLGTQSTGFMRLQLNSSRQGSEIISNQVPGYTYGYYETRALIDPEQNNSGGVCSFFLQGTGWAQSTALTATANTGSKQLSFHVASSSAVPQIAHPIGGNSNIPPLTHITAVSCSGASCGSGLGTFTITLSNALTGTISSGTTINYNYAYSVDGSEIDYEWLLNESWIGSGSTTGAVHITTHPSGASYSQSNPFQPGKGYHRYGILWTSANIKFYIDGSLVHTTTGGDATMPSGGNAIFANAWSGNPGWGAGPPNATISCHYDWIKFWPNVTSVPDPEGFPNPPTSPSVIAQTPTTLTLSWTAPTDGDEASSTYSIYRGTTAGGESSFPIASGITNTTWTDTTLSPGMTYYYKVASVDSLGNGDIVNTGSAEFSGTTASDRANRPPARGERATAPTR